MGVLLLRSLKLSVVVKWDGAGWLPHEMPEGTAEDQSGKVEQGVPYSYGLCSAAYFYHNRFPEQSFSFLCNKRSGNQEG
jgi:hypothetical protein